MVRIHILITRHYRAILLPLPPPPIPLKKHGLTWLLHSEKERLRSTPPYTGFRGSMRPLIWRSQFSSAMSYWCVKGFCLLCQDYEENREKSWNNDFLTSSNYQKSAIPISFNLIILLWKQLYKIQIFWVVWWSSNDWAFRNAWNPN